MQNVTAFYVFMNVRIYSNKIECSHSLSLSKLKILTNVIIWPENGNIPLKFQCLKFISIIV